MPIGKGNTVFAIIGAPCFDGEVVILIKHNGRVIGKHFRNTLANKIMGSQFGDFGKPWVHHNEFVLIIFIPNKVRRSRKDRIQKGSLFINIFLFPNKLGHVAGLNNIPDGITLFSAQITGGALKEHSHRLMEVDLCFFAFMQSRNGTIHRFRRENTKVPIVFMTHLIKGGI